MTFSRLHDRMAFDGQIVAAGNAAAGAYWRSQAWSSYHLTDGFIPIPIARTLSTPAQRRRLLGTELWSERDNGFLIPAWAAEQQTRDEIEMRRYEWRDRQERSRSRSKSTLFAVKDVAE